MKAGVAVAPPGLYCPTYFIATKLSPLRGYRVTSVKYWIYYFLLINYLWFFDKSRGMQAKNSLLGSSDQVWE